MKEYILSEEKLIENNYPVRHPEKPGCAVLFVDSKKVTGDRELSLGSIFEPYCKHATVFHPCVLVLVLLVKALKRICCRCGATYSVSQTGKHIRKEECTYHYGKGVTKKGKYNFEASLGYPTIIKVYYRYNIKYIYMNSSRWSGDSLQLLRGSHGNTWVSSI